MVTTGRHAGAVQLLVAARVKFLSLLAGAAVSPLAARPQQSLTATISDHPLYFPANLLPTPDWAIGTIKLRKDKAFTHNRVSLPGAGGFNGERPPPAFRRALKLPGTSFWQMPAWRRRRSARSHASGCGHH